MLGALRRQVVQCAGKASPTHFLNGGSVLYVSHTAESPALTLTRKYPSIILSQLYTSKTWHDIPNYTKALLCMSKQNLDSRANPTALPLGRMFSCPTTSLSETTCPASNNSLRYSQASLPRTIDRDSQRVDRLNPFPAACAPKRLQPLALHVSRATCYSHFLDDSSMASVRGGMV